MCEGERETVVERQGGEPRYSRGFSPAYIGRATRR